MGRVPLGMWVSAGVSLGFLGMVGWMLIAPDVRRWRKARRRRGYVTVGYRR